MLSTRRIFKDYADSGALHALVGLGTAVADGVYLGKGGELVRFLGIHPSEGECLDRGQTDYLARRFESVLRNLDERFRLYQYTFKREDVLASGTYGRSSVVQEAANSRLHYLQSKPGGLYAVDTYWAIAFVGWHTASNKKRQLLHWLMHPQDALRAALSSERTQIELRHELHEAIETMTNRVASFATQLGDLVGVEILDTERAYGVMRRLLNYTPYKSNSVKLKYSRFVDFQACDSALECHRDYLRLDDYYVQVLTLKEPPARTFATMLTELMTLPINMVIAGEWKAESAMRARQLIQTKRRHFYNSKSSLMNYANLGSETGPKDLLIDEGAAALVGDMGAGLKELDVHGRTFGQYSLTLVLYHKDLPTLRRAVAQCFKVFATHDAQLTEESYNRLNAWLAIIPGNTAHNLRRLWLLDTNVADLSLLCGVDRGRVTNDHLGSEYLAILEGRGNTPYYFNLHYKDVGHTLVFGATGSGKSFLLNFLLTHFQKYDPLTYVFDLGGSYETLTRLLEGSYLSVGKQTSTVTINPFCLPPTKENLLFLFSFVRVLAESNDYRMSSPEEQDLFEQIENLYALAPDQRRLSTLATLASTKVRYQLHKWVVGGPYGAFFDNVEDNVTLSRFQTFDFEGMERHPDQIEPLIFYILHRASAVIVNAEHLTTPKIFVIDEAWRFFRHPAIKAYIVEALKTWRKKNALMILATQSSEDLLSSDLLPVLSESCPTKLFLANPGMDRAAYQAAFHLNETEADLIARLVPKQEFLFKQPDVAKVLHLNVDPKEYWIYTSHPRESERRRQAFERYGFKQGLDLLAKEKL